MKLTYHLPQYIFMAWYLVKHKNNFNITFVTGCEHTTLQTRSYDCRKMEFPSFKSCHL